MGLAKIAIVGATGVVGRMFIKVMEERNIDCDITLFSSQKSAGSCVTCFGEAKTVKELREDSFLEGFDYALFSAGGAVSEKYAPIAAKSGAVVIDNSSRWRMEEDVPLVVPEVNPEDIFCHNGIIANPNCSTIEAVAAIAPIDRAFGIKKIVYTTFQAVSGAGRYGIEELERSVRMYVVGGDFVPQKFDKPIFGNCIPKIDEFTDDGFTKEEHKMINETRKILHRPSLPISATCVRVPVFNGHSESIYIETEKEFDIRDVERILEKAAGITLFKNGEFPVAADCCGLDKVLVGRVRKDPAAKNALSLWVVADNIRKGAATNAVQILEILMQERT